ncbi:hypothetical protein SI65_01111 [Aspergillus cristatus]|uniref:Only prolin and serin are matching in the corresponding protein n=1 Tax=Aspergillus cristatus TaxID=573508 RepID=A0A1E3BRC8_ASPCR|nr:hypothetical protein SI65_01111 [Aspergillus cristatus]
MLKLSQLLDAKRRDSSEAATADPSAISSRRSIQSPGTTDSSTPVSPALSLFSSKGHARVSSSVSSLVPSPGHGNSMESATRDHGLTGVQEEPCTSEARDLEQEYFQHFDQGLSVENPYFSAVDYFGCYDLTDASMDTPHSPKKRRSGSITSAKGLSRISSRVSTMSSRWKSRQSEDVDRNASYPDNWHPRTSSAASSALVSPAGYPVARIDSTVIPPSPARTIFEERTSESGARPLDIDSANRQFLEEEGDSTHQASTPLLPPFMGDGPMAAAVAGVTSPLESPTVADISDDVLNLDNCASAAISASWKPSVTIPSPPLSSQPSMTSFHNRPSASTMRSMSDGPSPLYMSDPNDEWANKLGHANFTIHPAPYMPDTCTMDSFCQLRDDWDLAQCNFAKHLVRTGEHYGVTSNIYKLTEAKWDATNREWKRHHQAMQSQLEETHGPTLSLTQSHFGPSDQVKIPRLHDNKFPELGDGEIVGPMKILPCQPRPSLKRSFFKFFQDLIGRS